MPRVRGYKKLNMAAASRKHTMTIGMGFKMKTYSCACILRQAGPVLQHA